MYKIKRYLEKYKNQVPIKQTIKKTISHCKNLDEEGLYTLLNSRTASKRERCIAYIVLKAQYHDKYFESEATIAKNMQLSRNHVSRIIIQLMRLGVITRKRRVNNSSIYTLNPQMRHPSIVERFGGLIPSLRGLLHVSLLFSLTVGMTWCKSRSENTYQENVELILKRNKESINNLTSYTYCDVLEDKKLHKKDNTAEDRPKTPVKVSRLDLIEHSKLKDIYPMLDEYGHYLAVQASMSPYQACYLALYPKEILLKSFVLLMFFVEEYKNTIKNPKACVVNLLNMVATRQGFVPDVTFLATIRDHYCVDQSWEQLSYPERTLLLGKLRKLSNSFSCLKEKCKQKQRVTFEDKELQQAQERLLKARSNPYSVSYSGPVLDPRESLKMTRSLLSRTPQNIAAAPPEAPAAQRHEGRIEADNIFARILNGENI